MLNDMFQVHPVIWHYFLAPEVYERSQLGAMGSEREIIRCELTTLWLPPNRSIFYMKLCIYRQCKLQESH